MQATSLIQILIQPGSAGQSTGEGANAGNGAAQLSAAGGQGNLFQATLGDLLAAAPAQATTAGQVTDAGHPAGQITAALLPAEAAETATDAITAANAASGTAEAGTIPLAALLPDGTQVPLITGAGGTLPQSANPALSGQVMTKGEAPAGAEGIPVTGTDNPALATVVADTPVAGAGSLIPGHGQTQTPDAAPDGQVLATAKGVGIALPSAGAQAGATPPGLDQAAAVTSANDGKATGLATAQTVVSTVASPQDSGQGPVDGAAIQMTKDPAVTTALSATPEHQAQARQAAGEITAPAPQNEALKEGQAPLPLPAGEGKGTGEAGLKPQAGEPETTPGPASSITPQGNAKPADTAGSPQAAPAGNASAASGKASAPGSSGTGTETSGLRADATAQPSQPLHNQQLSQPLQAAQPQQAEAPQQVQDLKQAETPRMETAAQPQGQQATQSQAVREGMVSTNLTRSDAAQRAVVQTVGLEITRAANARETSFTLRLDPPEMGRVEARLQFGQDGAVRAIVTADSRETLTMLQRDAGQLERALADAGLKPDSNSLSFNLKQQAQGNGQQDANGSGRMTNASGLADDEAEDMAAAHEMDQIAPLVEDGRVDIRI